MENDDLRENDDLIWIPNWIRHYPELLQEFLKHARPLRGILRELGQNEREIREFFGKAPFPA